MGQHNRFAVLGSGEPGGALDSGQFDLGQRFFRVRPIRLRRIRLGPIGLYSTSARENPMDFAIPGVGALSVGPRRVWGPKGRRGPEGWRAPKGVGAPKGGAPRRAGGPEGRGAPKGVCGGPEGWGGGGEQNFAFFFSLSRHNFLSFFSLLGVLSWNFGGV